MKKVWEVARYNASFIGVSHWIVFVIVPLAAGIILLDCDLFL